MIQFNEKVQELIAEFNVNSRANRMLYNDEAVAAMLKELHGVNRDKFIYRGMAIAKELIPHILPFHGQKVRVETHNGTQEGVIEHLATREYDNRVFDNDVAFRYKDATSKAESIALWVNTGDKYTTHLYTTDKIELVNELTTVV